MANKGDKMNYKNVLGSTSGHFPDGNRHDQIWVISQTLSKVRHGRSKRDTTEEP